MSNGILIYNLHPSLVGDINRWFELLEKIKFMEFNCVYISQIEKFSSSGSIHSTEDYYTFNDSFLDKNKDIAVEQITKFISLAHELNLKIITDLNINYSEINTDFYLEKCKYLLKLGFDGFKCNTPYKASENFWIFLINTIKNIYPKCSFLGETVDCTANETIMVAEVGFDYIFNRSKWWNFNDEWFLKDYKQILGCAPSISFPEYYNCPRLSFESNGNENASKTKYAFAALFSAGLLMSIGYEYGYKNALSINTSDIVQAEPHFFDISCFIKSINKIKSENPLFNEDNAIEVINTDNPKIFIFTKYSLDKSSKVMIILNMNYFEYERCKFNDIYSAMDNKLLFDISPSNVMKFIPKAYEYYLAPGEIRILITK